MLYNWKAKYGGIDVPRGKVSTQFDGKESRTLPIPAHYVIGEDG
jgi:hypothetical protein